MVSIMSSSYFLAIIVHVPKIVLKWFLNEENRPTRPHEDAMRAHQLYIFPEVFESFS